MKLSSDDRCILLLALSRDPELLDRLSTAAYVALQDGCPWAPYRCIREWANARYGGF